MAGELKATERRKIAGSMAYREVEAVVRGRLLVVVGDMSIAAFADAIRLNHESVRRAIRGGTITAELLMRVCMRFGISADWLLFGIGSKHAAIAPALPELKWGLGGEEPPVVASQQHTSSAA